MVASVVGVTHASPLRPGVLRVSPSGGYPATYKLGYIIEGLDQLDAGVMAFQAGTKADVRGTVTNGGRVVTVSARGATVAEARAKAYANAARIRFVDRHYRRDIAAEVTG